ncbi:hypothetical protein AGMMS50268_38130 [Spirochaetia bacterium]|nr:hypothetical protein AGMMS50268_38130 [Spirochaetia bacterium]
MLGTLPDRNQRELYRPLLTDLIDPQHELSPAQAGSCFRTVSTGIILKWSLRRCMPTWDN